jgi:hypothetical protein
MPQELPRRGTAAEWTSANPVLGVGEEGYEIDTQRYKRGDGITAWTTLGYADTAAHIGDASEIGQAILTAPSAAAVAAMLEAVTVDTAIEYAIVLGS